MTLEVHTYIVWYSLYLMRVIMYTGSFQMFGEGIYPVFMDFVNCTGSELKLDDCAHFAHTFGCTHDMDAGVSCLTGVLQQPSLCCTVEFICCIY